MSARRKNLWHCLGACQSGGSVIDWVMKAEGVSFRHAVELLREGLPALAASSRVVRQSTVPKLPAPVTPDGDDQQLLDQVIEYYHATLKQSPEALAYLAKRGIANAGSIDRFTLGYANRTLGLRLPEKNRKAGAEIRARLQRLGLIRDSGHEHFNGSLVIPILNGNGHVCGVYGRKILDNLRAGTPVHLYLPGPHRGVWNPDAFPASKEIILCESLIDALTFWCTGYRHVTAAYGVEGFTAAHRAAFKDHGTERVLLAYDRDDAGEKAAEALATTLMTDGIDSYRVLFPKGMDANEFALKVTPATKALGLVRKAAWLGNGAASPRELDGVCEPAPADVPAIAALSAEPASSPLAADPVSSEPLPASPMPPAPAADIPIEVTDTEVVIPLGARRYRVRGLAKNASHEVLKVNAGDTVADGVRFSQVTEITTRTYAIHTDNLGTPVRLSDQSGAVVWSWQRSPFGTLSPDDDVDGDGKGVTFNLRFPGQYYDWETGLHYNYFRTYDPSTGRYLESDPIGLGGGLNTYG